MEEFIWYRQFGGFGSYLDLATVFTFLVCCVVAFLAPVIGYGPRRPWGLAASLYLLVASIGIMLAQLLYEWMLIIDAPTGKALSRGREEGAYLLITFAVVKLFLFFLAMLAFAIGVLALRVRRPTSTTTAPVASASPGA